MENPYDSPMDARLPGDSTFLCGILIFVMVLSGTAFLFLALFMGPFAWILRDGLGPDSTESTSLQAVARMFWCFYWGPATLTVAIIFIATSILRRRLFASQR